MLTVNIHWVIFTFHFFHKQPQILGYAQRKQKWDLCNQHYIRHTAMKIERESIESKYRTRRFVFGCTGDNTWLLAWETLDEHSVLWYAKIVYVLWIQFLFCFRSVF